MAGETRQARQATADATTLFCPTLIPARQVESRGGWRGLASPAPIYKTRAPAVTPHAPVTLPRGPPFPVSFPAMTLPCVCVVLVPRVPFSSSPDFSLLPFSKTAGNLVLPDATRGDPGA